MWPKLGVHLDCVKLVFDATVPLRCCSRIDTNHMHSIKQGFQQKTHGKLRIERRRWADKKNFPKKLVSTSPAEVIWYINIPHRAFAQNASKMWPDCQLVRDHPNHFLQRRVVKDLTNTRLLYSCTYSFNTTQSNIKCFVLIVSYTLHLTWQNSQNTVSKVC